MCSGKAYRSLFILSTIEAWTILVRPDMSFWFYCLLTSPYPYKSCSPSPWQFPSPVAPLLNYKIVFISFYCLGLSTLLTVSKDLTSLTNFSLSISSPYPLIWDIYSSYALVSNYLSLGAIKPTSKLSLFVSSCSGSFVEENLDFMYDSF